MRLRRSAGARRPLSTLVAAVLCVALFGSVSCDSATADTERNVSALEQARAAYKSGDFVAAHDLLRAAVNEDPGSVNARKALALTLAALGDSRGAIEQYSAVVQLEPTDHESWYRMAVLERTLGRLEEATSHLGKAVEGAPAEADYVDELARTQMALGDYRSAAALWGGLLSERGIADEDQRDMLLLQGQALQAAKDYSGAAKAYRAALDLDPSDKELRARVAAFE